MDFLRDVRCRRDDSEEALARSCSAISSVGIPGDADNIRWIRATAYSQHSSSEPDRLTRGISDRGAGSAGVSALEEETALTVDEYPTNYS